MFRSERLHFHFHFQPKRVRSEGIYNYLDSKTLLTDPLCFILNCVFSPPVAPMLVMDLLRKM